MNEEDLLDTYLVDYDSHKNVMEMLDPLKKRIFRELILDKPRWEILNRLILDNEELKPFFQSLTEEDREAYFRFSVECMINFVQANFTGPELPEEVNAFLDENNTLFSKLSYRKRLQVYNEDINVNVKYPGLLYVARNIFKYCDFNRLLGIWWQLRGLMIHQQILEESSQVLFSQIDPLIKQMGAFILSPRFKAKFEIEQAQLFNTYRHVTKAKGHLETAANLLGIKYEFEGKLGKRTKYQENNIAQLVLHVELNTNVNTPKPVMQDLEVPKNITLDDDVRLDTLKLEDKSELNVIPDLEQKLLIAVIQEMLISKPQDNLYYEEIKAYLDLILNQKNTWAARAVTLLLRCKSESLHKRTIERSLTQCEEIVNCIKKEAPHPLCRVGGVFATNLLPVWKTEAQEAEIMLNLGLIKGSLDIYLRLQLWEEVIVCYTVLQKRHKAKEVIQKQLELAPTVKLWCLLGDATDDITCYETAWDFSNKRSCRAQRHWGQYFFTRKQYQQCIPHFEKSVSINPMQADVWLNYGFAALQTENWQTAATAYRRYTTLEPGCFEAWNNLAKAYIKLGNKRGAHQALRDAIKCNYDNWKVWDNLMAVSTDLGNFSDVILSYHRILDLKEDHMDVKILKILVCGVTNNINDSDGRPASHLLQKTRELLGRITSIYPTSGTIWEIYAELAPVMLLKAQRLQRSLRSFMKQDWEKDLRSCKRVLGICQKLAQLVLSDQVEPTDSLVNSVRLTTVSVISAVKKQDFEGARDLVKEVEELLPFVVEKNKTAPDTKK